MNNIRISASGISKKFGRQRVFEGLDFDFSGCGVFGISGSNGSGKSTLSLIIAGVISPSSGSISREIGGREIDNDSMPAHLGFASPYLVLYEELSPIENLKYFSLISGRPADMQRAEELFSTLNIYERRNDEIKKFSSGMKQRVKLVMSLACRPSLLILDEPASNLDSEGKTKVHKIIEHYSESIQVIVASNEQADLELCKSTINLDRK